MGEDWRGGYGRRSIERLNRRLAMGQVRNQPDSPILPPDIPGLVLWLRSDLGVIAVMSAVVPTGTAPPVVTLTGTPSPLLSVEIDITTPGLRGIALFQWKLGGVVQQTGLVTGANMALGTGTLAAQFTGGASVYVADNVYTATVLVSAWADQSGSGNNAIQATQVNQFAYAPTGGPASTPALTGNGTSTFMRPLFTLVQPYEVFCVAQYASSGVTGSVLDGANVNSGRIYRSANTTLNMHAGANLACPLGQASTNWIVYDTKWSAAASAMLVNGAQVASGNPSNTAPQGITIGATSAGTGDWLAGGFAEIAIYNSLLTTQQSANVSRYMGARYGISVS